MARTQSWHVRKGNSPDPSYVRRPSRAEMNTTGVTTATCAFTCAPLPLPPVNTTGNLTQPIMAPPSIAMPPTLPASSLPYISPQGPTTPTEMLQILWDMECRRLQRETMTLEQRLASIFQGRRGYFGDAGWAGGSWPQPLYGQQPMYGQQPLYGPPPMYGQTMHAPFAFDPALQQQVMANPAEQFGGQPTSTQPSATSQSLQDTSKQADIEPETPAQSPKKASGSKEPEDAAREMVDKSTSPPPGALLTAIVHYDAGELEEILDEDDDVPPETSAAPATSNAPAGGDDPRTETAEAAEQLDAEPNPTARNDSRTEPMGPQDDDPPEDEQPPRDIIGMSTGVEQSGQIAPLHPVQRSCWMCFRQIKKPVLEFSCGTGRHRLCSEENCWNRAWIQDSLQVVSQDAHTWTLACDLSGEHSFPGVGGFQHCTLCATEKLAKKLDSKLKPSRFTTGAAMRNAMMNQRLLPTAPANTRNRDAASFHRLEYTLPKETPKRAKKPASERGRGSRGESLQDQDVCQDRVE